MLTWNKLRNSEEPNKKVYSKEIFVAVEQELFVGSNKICLQQKM